MAEEHFESRPQGSMNMHPECPRPNIPENVDVSKWSGIDRSDMCTQRFTFGHIPKDHWEQIFGKRKT